MVEKFGIPLICAAVLIVAGVHPAAGQRIKGSDTLLPLSQALSEMYMDSRPEAVVTVTGGGSGVGISADRPGWHHQCTHFLQ